MYHSISHCINYLRRIGYVINRIVRKDGVDYNLEVEMKRFYCSICLKRYEYICLAMELCCTDKPDKVVKMIKEEGENNE